MNMSFFFLLLFSFQLAFANGSSSGNEGRFKRFIEQVKEEVEPADLNTEGAEKGVFNKLVSSFNFKRSFYI